MRQTAMMMIFPLLQTTQPTSSGTVTVVLQAVVQIVMGADLPFFGKAMQIPWMADAAPHKGGGC